MFNHIGGDQPIQVGFFLDKRFSMVPFVNFSEVFRIANRMADRCLFEWTVITRDGKQVSSNGGLAVDADASIGDFPNLPNVVVVAGNDPQREIRSGVAAWLRRLAVGGSSISALGSGSLLLAKAGLLGGYRATIHWEYLDSFREEFPDIDVSNCLFEIDRKRMTCAGGSAVVDLGLHLVHQHFGLPIAMAVSDQFILDSIRQSTLPQPVGARFPRLAHPVLARAIDLMENNLEDPLPIADLASSVGVTSKQFQRLFKSYLHTSPRQFYVRTRLDLARRLLTQSNLSVMEVALSCGFGSVAHFSRSYRDEFGLPPARDRRQRRLETGTVSHTHVRKISDGSAQRIH
ncbi:MAG: GlxA family transcriptional regulator [Boseongicola sp.]|nr:GlxA family transcriptional regulator [Boseongicola sp.]